MIKIPKVIYPSDGMPFRNFHFEDIYMNGKRLFDFEAFETDFVNTKDVTIQ